MVLKLVDGPTRGRIEPLKENTHNQGGKVERILSYASSPNFYLQEYSEYKCSDATKAIKTQVSKIWHVAKYQVKYKIHTLSTKKKTIKSNSIHSNPKYEEAIRHKRHFEHNKT